MKWFRAFWRKANGLDDVHRRLEDFYEVTIFQRSRGGYRAQGFYDQMDGDGLARSGDSMMGALTNLLLAQHEVRKGNLDEDQNN